MPGQGSVGASGDLAPLAHMTAVMIGEGEAWLDGARMPAAAALEAAGLEPIALGPKEGLALINGTQCSTALALGALFDTWRLAHASLVTGALSTDAAMGSAAPFRPEIHRLRGLAGQIEAAATLYELIEGSAIRESHREGDERVQDPYCLRCQPQVAGACLDLLRQAARDAAASRRTPSPTTRSSSWRTAPSSRAAISTPSRSPSPPTRSRSPSPSSAPIAQRRIAMLVNPALSFGLPAFLSPTPALNSGFMIAEVTAAALMAENKQRAAPCSTDSTPTSADQEDHVSMACHAARRLADMNDNLAGIVGIELLVAAQGVDLRAPLTTSAPLQAVVAALRAGVPPLEDDRYLAPDIEAATRARQRRRGVVAGCRRRPPSRLWMVHE